MTSQNPVKIGIAGLGRTGWNNHARALEQIKDKFTITAVSDTMESRLKEAHEKFNCKTYNNIDDLISDNDIEVVVIATPSHLHEQHTIKALQAGKNVVCEKPMADSLDAVDKMISAAKKYNTLLTVFQNRRYMPSFRKIREIIDSGILGRIVEIKITAHSFGRRWDWQTLKKFGGGTLNNTGAHYVDLALLLFGENEPEIFCHLDKALTLGDAEDHCKVILKGKNSPLIDVEITSACAYPQDRWLIMGTSGGLAGNEQELHWKFVDFSKLPERKVQTEPTPDRSYNSEQLPWQEQSWQRPQNIPSEQIAFYNDLYETLRNNAPLAITPESVRRQIEVLQKCHTLCPI